MGQLTVMEQLRHRAAKITAILDMRDLDHNVFYLSQPSPIGARRLYPRPSNGLTI